MRKTLTILAALAALVLSATATAGSEHGNRACKDFASAQTGDGQQIFDSRRLCVKYPGDLFTPTLAISPGHVNAGETFALTASGLHANASVAIYFYIEGTGPNKAFSPAQPTTADGSFSLPLEFAECRKTDTGSDVSADLTMMLSDSFGVHARAPLTLC